MHKFLKLSAVSMLAVMTASGANAAGYTCEELIEYTSCNPGYYLLDSRCPTGAFYYENVCCDGIDCSENIYGDEAGCLEADNVFNSYYANGCFVDSDDGYMYYRGSPSSSGSAGCADCPAGSTCAGGRETAKLCPAGSYCATTGLSEPTNVCAKGSYSSAGATACTTCPATELTDINGATVVATTLSTGSDSVVACIVGPDVQFKNDAGIYHFKSNCTWGRTLLNTTITTPAECDAIGGSWDDEETWCEVSDIKKYLPTKETCEAWRSTITDEDYRNAITCYEDGGATCNSIWLFDENGLRCDW